MELQFHKTLYDHLHCVKQQVQNQEQTQEVRIQDGLPDIGRILGTWGQVLLRGKQWISDGFGMSGGVMAWVLYEPEGGGTPCSVETWIPFQMNWELPESDKEGKIRLACLLKSIDARNISARKMIVRVNVSVLGQAYVPEQATCYDPEQLPDDIQVLKKTYPVLIPVEAGEKAVSVEEVLQLPGSCPKMESMIRYQFQSEIIDCKVMSDKVVFRGAGILHLVYLSTDGTVCSWDFEMPFSQYAQLDGIYDPEASVQVMMTLTNLELEPVEDGLLLKVGLAGQYLVSNRVLLEITEDAYSPCREIEPQIDTVALPVVLDERSQTISAEQTLTAEVQHVVDVAVYPDHPRVYEENDGIQIQLPGSFQILYYDGEGILQAAVCRYEQSRNVQVDPACKVEVAVFPTGNPQTVHGGGETAVRADVVLEMKTVTQTGVNMVCMLQAGEMCAPDPTRPSLILRRKGQRSLWQLAKESGSTVERILSANHLQEEPEDNRILLIPVI